MCDALASTRHYFVFVLWYSAACWKFPYFVAGRWSASQWLFACFALHLGRKHDFVCCSRRWSLFSAPALKKKKSGIYQTSTVHAKNTSIFIRIYVNRYLYLYLSLYSYRYSLHCTYFSFSFICCLACAPCKNFNLHLVTYGCFLCVSMCLRFCAWLHVS